jgi:hypothetical protein
MLGISSIALPTSGDEEGVAVIKTNSNLWQMSLVGYAADSKGLRVYNTGGTGYTSLEVATGAGTAFIVDGDGRAGIGTDSPNSKLEVAGNVAIGYTTAAPTNGMIVNGNVGIGTDSSNLENGGGQVIFNSTVPRLAFRNSTSGTTALDGTDLALVDSDFFVFNREAGAVILGTGGTEKMRITSGGAVLVNNSSGTGGFDHSFYNVTNQGSIIFAQTSSVSNPCAAAWNSASSGDNLFIRFFINSGGNIAGNIDYLRSAGLVRYNTTSDGNLKNIIGDSDRKKSIEILNSTKIREYSWKDDESNKPQIGVIAQELYETYKGAVSVGSDDELLGTEDYKPWAVDKTAFTFHLVAGFQEHERIIKELQEQIDSLKNQIK